MAVELHGHEDLLTFFDLNRAIAKHSKIPPTFEHHVDHLPGLSSLKPPPAPSQSMVHVDNGVAGQMSGLVAAKKTWIKPFFYMREEPPHISIPPLSKDKFERCLLFQGSKPLKLLDLTPAAATKKVKKKKKDKKRHRDGDLIAQQTPQ